MINSIDDLIVFLRRFHRSYLPDPSMPAVETPDGLPPSLGAIYRELGTLVTLDGSQMRSGRAPFSAQDRLLPVSRLTPATPLWCRGRYVEEEPSHDFWHVKDADVLAMNCSGTTWIGSPVHDISTCLAPGLRATPIF